MELGTQEALIETSGRGGDWPWALGSSQMAMLAGGVTEHVLDCIELAWPPAQCSRRTFQAGNGGWAGASGCSHGTSIRPELFLSKGKKLASTRSPTASDIWQLGVK